MEMYMVQHQRKKAKAFAEALKEWDAFKACIAQQLSTGRITKAEYDRRLEKKAEELDL